MTKRIGYVDLIIVIVQFLIWIAASVLLLYHSFHGVLYPQMLSKRSLVQMIMILAPFVILLLELFFVRGRWKNRVRGMMIALVSVLLAVWFILCNLVMAPIVSETNKIEHYLITDSTVKLKNDAYTLFPQRSTLHQTENRYLYYYDSASFLNGEDGYILLSSSFADEASFQQEKNRIANTGIVFPVSETWDGYQSHDWARYAMYASVRPGDKNVRSYFWVLIDEDAKRIVYYDRMVGFAPDTAVQSFLDNLNV